MKFKIENHFDRSKDIEWSGNKSCQGLRNKDNIPMTKREAEIFNDLIKYHAYVDISIQNTYRVFYD